MRFHADQSLARNSRRVLFELLYAARKELLRAEEDPVESVHEARKNLKKLRSMLRLLRPGLGEKAYKANNTHLRDIARSLSGQRDADVLAANLRARRDHPPGAENAQAWAEEIDGVAAARHQRIAPAGGLPPFAPAAREELARAGANLEALPYKKLRRRHLLAAIHKTVKRAARHREEALAAPEQGEALHDWRKRVKDLAYQIRPFLKANRERLKPLHKALKELYTVLGDIHDRDVLLQALNRYPGLFARENTRESIAHQLREERAALVARAEELSAGPDLLQPKVFVRDLERDWRKWQPHARRPRGNHGGSPPESEESPAAEASLSASR